MLTQLLTTHGFDPAAKPGELLIIQHKNTRDNYRLAPLVVLRTDTGYCVGRTPVAAGKLRLGLSVSFNLAGQPVVATDDFGSPADVVLATAELEQLIKCCYVGTPVIKKAHDGNQGGQQVGAHFAAGDNRFLWIPPRNPT